LVAVLAAGPSIGVGGIAVAEVKPARAIIDKHPPGFGESSPQLLDVVIRGGLLTVLTGNAVVAKSVVGRAGDQTVN
jgi:hypothetical protein